MNTQTVKKRIVNELLLFAALLFFGFIIMPVLIYLVGGQVFGDFDGGYGHFFGQLTSRIVSGNPVAWFLVLSPWLGIQVLRATWFGMRVTGSKRAAAKM